VRTLLEAAADRLAAANTSELVRLLGSTDQEVALEAVRRAGSLKTAAAVPALARLLQHTDAGVRLAAVSALGEIGTPGALQHLDRGIDDDDREVRIAAVRALGQRNHRASVQKIEAALVARRLQEGDLTEKMAFFEAFGALCGESGIPMLDGLLNKKGLFGKRGDAEVRACAAMALGRIGSDTALAALRRAGTDKDILVRNAVSKALRGTP
jgi:HEAT repeat protein